MYNPEPNSSPHNPDSSYMGPENPYKGTEASAEELDKREVAQQSAQDELSQALQIKEQPNKVGPPTEKISKPEDINAGDVRMSPFAQEAGQAKGDTRQKEISTSTEERSSVTETTPHNPAPQPVINTAAPAEQVAQEGYRPHPKLRTLRTMQSDMAQRVGEGESVTSIALAAHKKKEAQKEEVHKQTHPVPEHTPPQQKAPEPAPPRTRIAPHHVFIKKADSYKDLQQITRPKPAPPQNKLEYRSYSPTAGQSTGSMRGAAHASNTETLQVKNAVAIPFFKNVLFITVSILLVGVGGFGLYSVFFAQKVQDTRVETTQPLSPVQYNSFSDISFTNRDTLLPAIRSGGQTLSVSNGSVWYGHISDVSAESLALTLSPRMPDTLVRITKEPLALGYYRNNADQRFWMTAQVSTFGQAFAGTLKWEEYLYEDMKDLFIQEPAGAMYGFIDDIIGNKDVRKLVNTNGQSFIVYGFIDQNTLVLAEDELTFASIANNIFAHRSTR